jgi:hypothetical protein
MPIWAIADLHLSLGVPDKSMDVFGAQWINHVEKIAHAWRSLVSEGDLVLIPGDISWAMHTEDARPDLEWLGQLPGIKVMIKGNHDYWWGSISKIKIILPNSCHVIQNNVYNWGDVTIAGARLWDAPGLDFASVIHYEKNERVKNLTSHDDSEEKEKIYLRELGRLETSLKMMNPKARVKIAMTHYPPIGLEGQATAASDLLEKYGVDICVFGHLHNVKPGMQLFGEFRGVKYFLTACDYLDQFKPLRIG